MKMESQTMEDEQVTILEIGGRFDAYEAPQVRKWFQTQEEAALKYTIVNLTQVDFIDSSALAALVQGMKRCRQINGDLYLSGLQPQVKIIFELTRLDKAFKIYETDAEAIEAFNKK